MKIIIITIGTCILIILLALFVSSQIEGAPPSGEGQPAQEGLTRATELMNEYTKYFGYFEAVVGGRIGSLLWSQGLSLIMKEADPNTKATITFVQTLKSVKNMHGSYAAQKQKEMAAQKQQEIEQTIG